jgi:hypothetical protein
MQNQFLKGLVMALIAYAATVFANGIPAFTAAAVPAWESIGLNVVSVSIGYIVINAAFPTTSILGIVNTRDLLKATLSGIVSGISSYLGTYAMVAPVDWHALATIVLATAAGALGKSFLTKPAAAS